MGQETKTNTSRENLPHQVSSDDPAFRLSAQIDDQWLEKDLVAPCMTCESFKLVGVGVVFTRLF